MMSRARCADGPPGFRRRVRGEADAGAIVRGPRRPGRPFALPGDAQRRVRRRRPAPRLPALPGAGRPPARRRAGGQGTPHGRAEPDGPAQGGRPPPPRRRHARGGAHRRGEHHPLRRGRADGGRQHGRPRLPRRTARESAPARRPCPDHRRGGLGARRGGGALPGGHGADHDREPHPGARRAARGASGPPRGRGDRRRPARGAGARPGARGRDPGGERDATRPRGERPAPALRCRAAGLPVRGPGVRRAPDALPGRCRACRPADARRRPHAAPPGRARLRGLDGPPRAARRDGPRAARRGTRVDSVAGRRYRRRSPPSDTMSSRLGEALQKRGDLTAEQVTHAAEQQREHGGALSTHLVRLGFVTEEKLLSYLEREYRLPVVDPLSLDIPREVLRIRFRIDGVVDEIMQPPLRLKNALTSRIKVMAQLDIAERRLPQDGRIKMKLAGNKEMDFRVSVLPTMFGEKVVLRLLDKSNLQLDMTKLGFEERALKHFKDAIYKPFGMVLVTGPTGSGKTTTLYSALAELNKVSTNISTAEDPIEFNLVGINQVQMHDEIGLNFAAALRAFLRQDPDVIMVGEIRDFETAEIGVKAALTGHLVLSTLHTNDAPSTVNRLLNMGVEPFLVASSINLIMAQITRARR